MKNKTVNTVSKTEKEVTISRAEVGLRDLHRVSIISRKKGAHKDIRREADKNRCRKKVNNYDHA